MNNAAFHSPYFFLNLVTLLSLWVPVLAVLINSACRKNLLFLSISTIFLLFSAVALVNNDVWQVSPSFRDALLVAAFMLPAPLILSFLPFFLQKDAGYGGWRKVIYGCLLAYLASVAALAAFNGLNESTGAMVTGAGYLLVLMFSMPVFFGQVKATVQKRLNPGKAFMATAIVFSFACYLLVSLMHLGVDNHLQAGELFLLFQLATLFFSVLMSVGIFIYKPDAPPPTTDKKVVRLPMLTEWEEYSGN